MSSDALEAATEIGMTLVSDAVWYRGRCNWIGADFDDIAGSVEEPETIYAPLGPDLYGGTAGVALFLAQLAAATGDDAFVRAAVGAIRHSFARADDIHVEVRNGFHAGWLGVAVAGAYVAKLLDVEEPRELAERLHRRRRREGGDARQFDLVAGKAGGVAGLITLSELLNDQTAIDDAVLLADALVMDAERSQRGLSWRDPRAPYVRNLCGFSHGTAGVAYALVELYARTSRESYRLAADGAFAYERSWFEPSVGNWPDLRNSGDESLEHLSYPALWCHGSSGIALSRLRAFEILGEEMYEQEALIALDATAAATAIEVVHDGADFSLCHGLSGNAEVLGEGQRILGNAVAGEAIAASVADCGVRRYAAAGRPWPCGIHTGQTPNLYLGLAGIGLFYLRLHDPSIPSPLFVHSLGERTRNEGLTSGRRRG